MRGSPSGLPAGYRLDRERPVRNLGPLVLEPILVPKPWGGRRLEALGKRPGDGHPAGTVYGESWEVADLGAHLLSGSQRGRTRVARGAHRGKTLRRLVAELGAALVGSASPTPDGDFPLLVKLLDTAEHLSIQVHPDESYAAGRLEWSPKTESWYVLHAEPGAVIFKDFLPGVGLDEVRAAAGTPDLPGLLRRVGVRRGEFHHLPAGTVHALGAGVTVAEVQTPSDTTFRLYDWTVEYDRPPRPLQIRQGLEALFLDPPSALSLVRTDREGARLLVDTPFYWIREHRGTEQPMILRELPELRVLVVARGRAGVTTDTGSPLQLGTGSTVVVPASSAISTRVSAVGTTTLLEIGLM